MRPTAVLLALGACLLAACTAPPPVRYEDLVAREIPGGAVPPGEQIECGDRTLFSRPLDPGEGAALDIELGEEPRLVLEACRMGSPGVLTVTVDTGGVVDRRLVLDLGEEAWVRREEDLAGLAGRRVTVRLAAEGPAGPEPVAVSEAVVRHRPPAPALAASGAGGRARRAPKILLVSFDTLRADLGDGSSPTPAFDRLAADAEVYDRHYATGSWTKPSHASMLTGQRAPLHGVRGGGDPLEPAVPLLAELLRAAGLATGGLVHDCAWLDPKWGFGRGFDSYRSLKWTSSQLARGAVNWMAEHRDEPFFYFLHLFNVHSDFHHLPYEAPGVTQASVEERFDEAGYGCREGACSSALLARIREGTIAPLPREGEILSHLYTAGVAEADGVLAGLRADLEDLGLWDDLLVVVTSDHGELLLEHGETLHGQHWDEVLRVPFYVKWPDGERAGWRVEVPTTALDLAPTVLAAAGLASDALPGADLHRPPPRRRPLLAEYGRTWQTVHLGPLKAVLVRGGEDLLFDLAADPREARSLAARRPEDLERLRALAAAADRRDARLLRKLRAGSDGAAPDAHLTEEEKERLRSLGYLRGP